MGVPAGSADAYEVASAPATALNRVRTWRSHCLHHWTDEYNSPLGATRRSRYRRTGDSGWWYRRRHRHPASG